VKQIEKFVHSIYRNIDGDKEEISDLKEEMYLHLIESVKTLQSQGKTEDEAVRIAIEQFGGRRLIMKELSHFFSTQKQLAHVVLAISLISFIVGIILLGNAVLEIREFRGDRLEFTSEILNIIDETNNLTETKEDNIENIFERYQDHINKLAVFKVDEDLSSWVSNNPGTQNAPVNVYPISYEKANIVINKDGILTNKDDITTSKYDLGTVARSKGDWIVQYEYKDSYRSTIERNNSLLLGSSYLVVYPLTTIFFVSGLVLLVTYFVLKKNSSLLNKILYTHK